MNLHDTIKLLNKFEQRAEPAMFQEIFGSMYLHLWNKFRNLKHSVIDFYLSLDEQNQQALLTYLSSSNF